MLFLSCVCYAFVGACLLVPCGQLLGKWWPLGSRLWCLIVCLLLSHWCPGSGVVLACIDSWSLPSSLLFFDYTYMYQPTFFCLFSRALTGFWKQELRTHMWHELRTHMGLTGKNGSPTPKSWSPTNLCIPYMYVFPILAGSDTLNNS